jgi:hypothetical protein
MADPANAFDAIGPRGLLARLLPERGLSSATIPV